MAASKVLRAAGVHATPGEDVLRRVRVLRLIIPRVTIGLLAARPRRTHYLQRMAALFGDARGRCARRGDRATLPAGPSAPSSPHTSSSRRLCSPTRPARSARPDGTVDIGEHAGLDVIDFKTDAPPRESAARSYPEYVAQVRAYGALLAECGAARDRSIRTGLLFSADGSIHWV